MPLPTALTTNEVKDSTGAEVEFSRQSTEGRKVIFAKVGEFGLRHRLSVSHTEIGSGAELRRRSAIRVDIDTTGASMKTRTCSAYTVVDIPIGDLEADTVVRNSIAELMSFIATAGGTTILYDGTGTGASALVAGSL